MEISELFVTMAQPSLSWPRYFPSLLGYWGLGELGWEQYPWLQIILAPLPQTDGSEKCLGGTMWQRYAYLPQNTLASLGWRIWPFSQAGSPLGEKKRLCGEIPESFTMPKRLTAILSTPGVCVILRKHKCITSLQGQDESFSSHQ